MSFVFTFNETYTGSTYQNARDVLADRFITQFAAYAQLQPKVTSVITNISTAANKSCILVYGEPAQAFPLWIQLRPTSSTPYFDTGCGKAVSTSSNAQGFLSSHTLTFQQLGLEVEVFDDNALMIRGRGLVTMGAAPSSLLDAGVKIAKSYDPLFVPGHYMMVDLNNFATPYNPVTGESGITYAKAGVFGIASNNPAKIITTRPCIFYNTYTVFASSSDCIMVNLPAVAAMRPIQGTRVIIDGEQWMCISPNTLSTNALHAFAKI